MCSVALHAETQDREWRDPESRETETRDCGTRDCETQYESCRFLKVEGSTLTVSAKE